MTKLVLISLVFTFLAQVLSQECRATFSSACAVRNAYNLATKTYNALVASQTPSQLQNVWREITYGSTYRIAGGFFPFVFDWADHCKAHGGNPMNVGIELRDIIYRDNFCTSINIGEILRGAANITGGSWATYQWVDHLTPGWPAPRRAWVRKFSLFKTDYYVGVAYVDTDEDWEFMPCTQTHSHFCAQENAVNLARCAARDLTSLCSTGPDVDAFLASVNSQRRYRLASGFFVTVNLFSGTQVGNGLIPSFVGKTIAKITEDLKIFDFVPRNLQEQLRFAAANHSAAWVSHPWTNVVSGSTTDTYTFSVYAPSLNDYFVTSGFENNIEALCPDCNCKDCQTESVCAPCPLPPVETVTEIAFKFKGLTCAGTDDMSAC